MARLSGLSRVLSNSGSSRKLCIVSECFVLLVRWLPISLLFSGLPAGRRVDGMEICPDEEELESDAVARRALGDVIFLANSTWYGRVQSRRRLPGLAMVEVGDVVVAPGNWEPAALSVMTFS